jgi:hypothetical protein
MLKRLGVVGAMVGVAALAAGSVGPATGGNPARDGDHRHTVRVLSTLTEEAFVDVGETDFSLGDSFVASANLTRHGKKVGHVGVVCTIVSVAREESQCVGTAKLRRGQITVQGLVTEEGEDFRFPITGGTGAYEAAGGTLVVRTISDTKERLIFRVIH